MRAVPEAMTVLHLKGHSDVYAPTYLSHRARQAPALRPRRGQLRDGFRYAAGIPEIIRPLIMMALVGTFAFEFEVSFPLLAQATFQGGADAYSKLLGAFGAGAVIGGVYAAARPRTGVVRLGHIAFLYAATMMALALAPILWAAVGASALVGLAAILFLTTGNATVQLASDPHYRGRVMALWSTALVGSAPIGAPVVGAVSEALDPRAAIALGAFACVAAGAVSLVGSGKLPSLRERDIQRIAVKAGGVKSGDQSWAPTP